MSLYSFKMPGSQPHTFADQPVKKGAFVVVSITTKEGGMRLRPALVRSVWGTGYARTLWIDRRYGEAEAQVYVLPGSLHGKPAGRSSSPPITFTRTQHDEWDSLESARAALSALLPAR